MSWKPRNKQVTETETAYRYFGTMNKKGTEVLVYGDKPEATPECEKPREPQSRRAINLSTITKMIRGTVGIGEVGVDALAPLGNGREVVDVECLGDEESPYRNEYIAACEIVANEMDDDEVPDWIREAIEA